MFKYTILVILLFTQPKIGFCQRLLTLKQVVYEAISNSPSSRHSKTLLENKYLQYKFFKTNYHPQLRFSGSIPNYSRIFIPVRQNDGTVSFRSINQINSQGGLTLLQPIGLTGGTISANTSLTFFNDIGIKSQQWSSTLLNIQLDQPLFSFNSLKWDKLSKPIELEESKREYAEQKEIISEIAVDLFFSVLESQINLKSALTNLHNNDTIYKIELNKFNLGLTSKDKLLQIELQLLRSQTEVAQSKLDFQTSLLQLNSHVNLIGDSIQLDIPDKIPDFKITTEDALKYAKISRSLFQGFERRRVEAEREIAKAKGSRFQTTLSLSYGINNSTPLIDQLLIVPQQQEQVNLIFSMPIIDWGRSRTEVKIAQANKELTNYIIEQDRINFEEEIISIVGQFTVLKKQIEITKKSDQIADERYMISNNMYLIGKIDLTNLNIALTEKDNAKRTYIQTLKSFWKTYYKLRRLTLFDFEQEVSLINLSGN